MLSGGRTPRQQVQVDIAVSGDQNADAVLGAAANGMSRIEHALRGGCRDVSEQLIACAQHGQQIPGRRQEKSDK